MYIADPLGIRSKRPSLDPPRTSEGPFYVPTERP